jgi:hypothetical protein
MAPVREVAFELECFEWAEERLEVAGRWKGLGPHRLNRPVLTIETDGRRKRIVAMPGGHVGVAGDTWRATFAWPGDPAEITGAELEVGGSLVVELPLPDRRRRRRRRPAVDEPDDEALRAEVGALRGQIDRLRAELAGREREIIALHAQLADETGEDDGQARAGADERTVEIGRVADGPEPAGAGEHAGADEMTVEIQRLAGEVERLQDEKQAGAQEMGAEIRRLTADVERLAAERDAAVAAERERWQGEIDELREAFADAAAEAEAVRDRHRAELEALESQLRRERAEVARLSTQVGWLSGPGADRDEAAGPPTVPMPPPEGPSGTETIEPAALDAPGPLRAASRPAAPPGAEDPAAAPVTLEDSDEDGPAAGASAFQALKARFEGLFASNGDGHHDDGDDELAVPRPRRTAAAARARAGATVAARRSPGEVWAMRVLAAFVVAVLLTAFVLILAYIA